MITPCEVKSKANLSVFPFTFALAGRVVSAPFTQGVASLALGSAAFGLLARYAMQPKEGGSSGCSCGDELKAMPSLGVIPYRWMW